MTDEKPPSLYVTVVEALFRTLAPVSAVIIAFSLTGIFLRLDSITTKYHEETLKTMNAIRESQEEMRTNQADLKRIHDGIETLRQVELKRIQTEIEKLRQSVKPEVK